MSGRKVIYRSQQFAEGDLVYAKVRYDYFWPARITKIRPNWKFDVVFFGTFQTGTAQDILRLTDETRKRCNTSRLMNRKEFADAVKQINEEEAKKHEHDDLPGRLDFSDFQRVVCPSTSKQAEEELQLALNSYKTASGSEIAARYPNSKGNLLAFIETLRARINDIKSGLFTASGDYLTQLELILVTLQIKQVMGRDKANPEQAIALLELLKNQILKKLSPQMILSNPDVVEVVSLLSNYVGNVEAWKFSDQETRIFNKKAAKIREIAEEIFKSFKAR